jgi:hypothetical protein
LLAALVWVIALGWALEEQIQISLLCLILAMEEDQEVVLDWMLVVEEWRE